MMYTRASASDYDDWETVYQNPGWGSKNLIPLLRKAREGEDLRFVGNGSEGRRSRRTRVQVENRPTAPAVRLRSRQVGCSRTSRSSSFKLRARSTLSVRGSRMTRT